MTLDLTTLFQAAVIAGGVVATAMDVIRWRRGDRELPDVVRAACFWILAGSIGVAMSTPVTAGLFAVLALGPWDRPAWRSWLRLKGKDQPLAAGTEEDVMALPPGSEERRR